MWRYLCFLILSAPVFDCHLRNTVRKQNKSRLLQSQPCTHGTTAISNPLDVSNETVERIFGGSPGVATGKSKSRSKSESAGEGGKGKGGENGKGKAGNRKKKKKQQRSSTVLPDSINGRDSQNRLSSPNVAVPHTGDEPVRSSLMETDVLCGEEEPIKTSGGALPVTLNPEPVPVTSIPGEARNDLVPDPLVPSQSPPSPGVVPLLVPGPIQDLVPGPTMQPPAQSNPSTGLGPRPTQNFVPGPTIPTPTQSNPFIGLAPGQSQNLVPGPTIPTQSTSTGLEPSPLSPGSTATTDSVRSGCEDAFVYCPGRTSCYVDETGNAPGWGFSIDLNLNDPLTVIDNCEIWKGVDGCSLASGEKVGTATISKNMFHFCLDPGVYESNLFFLYAGRCMANDGGAQFLENGSCDDETMAANADNLGSFPLIHQLESASDTFTFDLTSPVNWPGYKPFPLGEPKTRHVVAHVIACPVAALDSDPLVGRIGASFPSAAPNMPAEQPISEAPLLLPTAGGSGLPTASNQPPTQVPNSLGTIPSVASSQKPTISTLDSSTVQTTPTFSPVPLPQFVDFSGNVVTVPNPSTPTTDGKLESITCQDAWVYCPGRSKCLNNPEFNDGRLSAVGPSGNHDIWGWSIEYDPEKDFEIEDCAILVGADDCDMNTAIQVGTFSIRKDYCHFCLDDYGYAASIFGLYSGTCRGNDGGFSMANDGECSAEEIALNAAKPQSFPIFRFDSEMTINYTIDFWDPVNIPQWPGNHQVFPISTRSYFSAYTCVTKTDDFVRPSSLYDPGAEGLWSWGQGDSTEPDHLYWDREEEN